MKKVLAAITLLLLSVGAQAKPLGSAEYAMQYVCETLKEQLCEVLPAPEIRFVNLWGSLGRYSFATPNVVYIDIRYQNTLQDVYTADPLALSVLIHEVVHYVHVKTARVHAENPEYWPNACLAESMAWSVGNTWLVQRGYARLAAWGWRAWYRCPVTF